MNRKKFILMSDLWSQGDWS